MKILNRKNLYVDNGGELEYYILRESAGEYTAHAFRIMEDGETWKHWEMRVEVTPEMLETAINSYGSEDADFLAALDELQQWPPEPEELTKDEKENFTKNLLTQEA